MKTEAELAELASLLPEGYQELANKLNRLNKLFNSNIITGSEADGIINDAVAIIRNANIIAEPITIEPITDEELNDVIKSYPKYYFEKKDNIIDVYINTRFEKNKDGVNELAYRGELKYTFIQEKITKQALIEQLNIK